MTALLTLLVAAVVAAVLAVVFAYGRWAGWGFGLGWWGRPTPAVVVAVAPLTGAHMRGGAPWAVHVARQRGRARLELRPADGAPYEASAIVWTGPTMTLAGREITTRVSRTRPRRVLVPRSDQTAPPSPEVPAPY